MRRVSGLRCPRDQGALVLGCASSASPTDNLFLPLIPGKWHSFRRTSRSANYRRAVSARHGGAAFRQVAKIYERAPRRRAPIFPAPAGRPRPDARSPSAIVTRPAATHTSLGGKIAGSIELQRARNRGVRLVTARRGKDLVPNFVPHVPEVVP